MTKFACVLSFILFILSLYLTSFAQTNKNSIGNSQDYKYWEETSLKFKILGIFSPKETENKSHDENGYGASLSIQFPVGRVVSLYGELEIGSIRQIDWETSTPNPYLKSDKKEPFIIIQGGIRTYPKRVEFPVYLKSGLALSFPYPIFVMGAGYDFILSENIGIFPETEILTAGTKSSTKYSFSIGLSLYH